MIDSIVIPVMWFFALKALAAAFIAGSFVWAIYNYLQWRRPIQFTLIFVFGALLFDYSFSTYASGMATLGHRISTTYYFIEYVLMLLIIVIGWLLAARLINKRRKENGD